jgi:hypothetical protein
MREEDVSSEESMGLLFGELLDSRDHGLLNLITTKLCNQFGVVNGFTSIIRNTVGSHFNSISFIFLLFNLCLFGSFFCNLLLLFDFLWLLGLHFGFDGGKGVN